MTLRTRASLLLACAWLSNIATSIAAAERPHAHEARQGPISILPFSVGPGPQSIQTSSLTSTTPETTTMSPTTSTSPSPSSSSSSGASSATPQPSASPYRLSLNVQNATTCTSSLISWKYSGKDAQLLLSITNIGVPQDGSLLHIGARQNTVNTTIQKQLANTNTSALSWTWSTVNVPQGWYEIQGLALSSPTVRNVSVPFFISNGTNVACLTGSTPPQTSALSTASSSASVLPSSVAPKSNVATLVGATIGGVLGVALVIIVGLCLWLRRRKAALARRGGSGDANWASLKSNTSSVQPDGSAPPPINNRFHSHSESTGAILQDVAGGKISATSTPGNSDEDTIMNEEKLVTPASSYGASPLDALNTPVHNDRRVSAYSVQTPTSVANEAIHSRVPSTRASNQSLEQQALRIRSSMETSMRRRSDRLSMPTLPCTSLSRTPSTLGQTKEEYPLTSVTPTPVSRSISAGAVSMTVRRTVRKPVPQYDSSILLEDKNADSVSTFTGGAESSQSHGTELGTGAYGTPPDLVRKASLGDGRPVRLLIPDMPLPQQD